MNPYEPPEIEPKFRPPPIDWLGIFMFFSVIFSLIFGYLVFVSVIVSWFK